VTAPCTASRKQAGASIRTPITRF